VILALFLQTSTHAQQQTKTQMATAFVISMIIVMKLRILINGTLT
jgi:hypothetical protein